MLSALRLRDLRTKTGLRQEDMAFLLRVGVASVNRWEQPRSSLPTGLPRQVYEAMDRLDVSGVSLEPVGRLLRAHGNLAAIRWLLEQVEGSPVEV